MTVFVDPSDVTFVYGCQECPWWRGVTFSAESAEEQAIRHEESIHGTQMLRRARDRRHARRAAKIAKRAKVDGSTPEHLTHGLVTGVAARR
jgi:hypothetical protein